MKIKVTETHIQDSERYSCDHCMVATAIEDAIPNVRVHASYDVCHPDIPAEVILGYDYYPYKETVVKLPLGIGAKMSAWDHWIPTDPFEFELNVPEDFL